MGCVIQERPRQGGEWITLELVGQACEMSQEAAEEAVRRLRRHFGDEFEYRVVDCGSAASTGHPDHEDAASNEAGVRTWTRKH